VLFLVGKALQLSPVVFHRASIRVTVALLSTFPSQDPTNKKRQSDIQERLTPALIKHLPAKRQIKN